MRTCWGPAGAVAATRGCAVAKDRLQNYVRHSAHDLSEQALRDGLAHLARTRPDFVVGYSRYLDELARSARDWRIAGRGFRLKAVIAAAESLPALDSSVRIQELFEARLAMEYGAVETGLIAHTHPEGGYRVFWHSYLLECHGDGAQEVHATSLFPRCTPLFRYRLGDRFEPGGHAATTAGCSVLAFSRVLGRSNAPVVLPSGRTLHSESVSHIARDQPKVLAYQFACTPGHVALRLKTRAPLTDEETAFIRRVATGIDAELGETLQRGHRGRSRTLGRRQDADGRPSRSRPMRTGVEAALVVARLERHGALRAGRDKPVPCPTSTPGLLDRGRAVQMNKVPGRSWWASRWAGWFP